MQDNQHISGLMENLKVLNEDLKARYMALLSVEIEKLCLLLQVQLKLMPAQVEIPLENELQLHAAGLIRKAISGHYLPEIWADVNEDEMRFILKPKRDVVLRK